MMQLNLLNQKSEIIELELFGIWSADSKTSVSQCNPYINWIGERIGDIHRPRLMGRAMIEQTSPVKRTDRGGIKQLRVYGPDDAIVAENSVYTSDRKLIVRFARRSS